MHTFTLAKNKDAKYGYALYKDGDKVATWDEKKILKSYVDSQVAAQMRPEDVLKEVSLPTPFPKSLAAPKPTKAPKPLKTPQEPQEPKEPKELED